MKKSEKKPLPPLPVPAVGPLWQLLSKKSECRHPSKAYLLKHWPRCWSCGEKLLEELYISPGCSHNIPKDRPTEDGDWYGALCGSCNDYSMRRPWTDASWHAGTDRAERRRK
jgi:hypothetical protein